MIKDLLFFTYIIIGGLTFVAVGSFGVLLWGL